MPKAYPPPPLVAPKAVPFILDDGAKRDLAHALGLASLSDDIAGLIAHAISSYKATETGSRDTTVANTLAALAELEKTGTKFDRAIASIADDRAGIDYTTHERLQPLARAVLAGGRDTRDAFVVAAAARQAELQEHARVEARTEALRFFCGVLRVIFNRAIAGLPPRSRGDLWHDCRKFALAIFAAAGIDERTFVAHPDRLTEYLGTDVSVGVPV